MGPRARCLSGAVRLVAVHSLPPGAVQVISRGASGRRAKVCDRTLGECPVSRALRRLFAGAFHTAGVASEWVAAARATPSGDHALAASLARCNWSLSIFA